MKVGKTGQQIDLVFIVKKNKVVAHGSILAVYGENMAKQIQERPEEYSHGQKKSWPETPATL